MKMDIYSPFLIVEVSVVPLPRVSRAPPLIVRDCAGFSFWMFVNSVSFIRSQFKNCKKMIVIELLLFLSSDGSKVRVYCADKGGARAVCDAF